MDYKTLITSEQVSSGHPDKMADQIADAILDDCLRTDKQSKVAIEVLLTNTMCVIGGEILAAGLLGGHVFTRARFQGVAKEILKEKAPDVEYKIIVNTGSQSAEITNAVLKRDEIGAGDQGIVYGFATNETKNYMPLAIDMCNLLVQNLEANKKEEMLNDGKVQITLEYVNGVATRVDTVVVSWQHGFYYNPPTFKKHIQNIIETTLSYYDFKIDNDTKILINPAGVFLTGGSIADTGLTGRKIIADTYGGYARHGGGSFSGKDATKIDRSAAYMARHIAKSIVASKLADECEIQLAFAIGKGEPVSINVTTKNAKLSNEEIINLIKKNFDLSVMGIIKTLQLDKPIYKTTTCYGHFTNQKQTWEQIKTLHIGAQSKFNI